MKKYILYLVLLTVQGAWAAEMPVIDLAALVKAAEEILVLRAQLEQLRHQVKRQGDPAAVKLPAGTALRDSLDAVGAGRSLEEIRSAADGAAALRYDGNGLYRPPGEFSTTADGRQVPRDVAAYRKFDAVTQAKTTLEDVMKDTQERRQQMRQQIKDTVAALQAAPTLAETHKLVGVLTAQNAELSAIDHEREAALSRVLVQQIENQNDAARQAQAEREDRAASFRAAREQLAQFLAPDTKAVHISDPRNRRP